MVSERQAKRRDERYARRAAQQAQRDARDGRVLYHVGTDRNAVVKVLQEALATGMISLAEEPLIERRKMAAGVEYRLTILPGYRVLAGEPTLH